jgi:DNA-binding transcriptional regulator GbsR (MarR family)
MNKDRLSPTVRTFVTHWGEMGTRWGINRTVAQIHALLYISEKPLNADDLVECLDVARSNISMSIKELTGWGLVTLVHLPGDRRDHFTTPSDVWELFRIIIAERKRREFDPTLQAMATMVANSGEESAEARRRLKELNAFMGSIAEVMDQLKVLPPSALAGLVGAAGVFSTLLPKRGSS